MIFEWLFGLKWLFGSKPVIQQRSTKDGESLTEDELSFMVHGLNKNLSPCPDCEEGFFLNGPQGGASINCLCNYCFSEFNLCRVSENHLIGERISDPKGCRKDRCSSIYGVYR